MYDGVARKSAPYLFLGQTTSLCETCLALVPAKKVAARALSELNGQWLLELDAAGRPLGWRPRNGTAHAPPVPLTAVGPDGTARNLLDAAISSPARTAVQVDADGRAVGLVTYEELGAHLTEALT